MKWFRVATEGATTDGRAISRTWIEQMAKNFNRATYGARVWMEHMRGLFADGPFAALGDVVAVKAEEVEGKLALFVQIDPTEKLKEINSERQKVYTSIEVDADFAGTGEAYLVGLAVTDSPASLGTEMLQFSQQQGEKSPLSGRKLRPENLFTASIETELDFSEEKAVKPSLLDTVKALFNREQQKSTESFDKFHDDLKSTLELFVGRVTELETELGARASADQFNTLKGSHDALNTKFEALFARLDNEPDTLPRPPATGGDGAVLTDC